MSPLAASGRLLLGLALLAACNQAPPTTAPIATRPVVPGPDLATLTDGAARPPCWPMAASIPARKCW